MLLDRFCRREDGNMTLLALLFFTCMVMFGGFAVDLMRYEADRTHLQNSLDRAALASASLNQTLTPQAVVNDYLEKEGLEGNLQKLDITIRDNSRSVSLVGRRDPPYFFAHVGDRRIGRGCGGDCGAIGHKHRTVAGFGSVGIDERPKNDKTEDRGQRIRANGPAKRHPRSSFDRPGSL
jgi:hypothetical protein